MRRVTIREVAQVCGVSEATVSNALADKPIVTQATKALVRAQAERLGYRASPLARALRTGRTWTVGMVVSNLANPFYGDIVQGAEDVLSAEGYQLVLCNTDHRADRQRLHVDRLLQRRVDGMLLVPWSSDPGDAASVIAARVPLVSVLRRPGVAEAGFVGLDDAAAVELAMDHLWSLGHRRIALLHGHLASSTAAAKRVAWEAFLRGRGIDPQPDWERSGGHTLDSARAAAASLLQGWSGPAGERPTAILGTSEFMALGAIVALHEAGLAVPAAMSVVGFDDSFVGSLPQVQLTSVATPHREMGEKAARMLLRGIARPDDAAERLVLSPDFLVRGTTGPAPPRP